jgi:hypothetical protein
MSHRLSVELTKTDEDVFLSIEIYWHSQREFHKRWPRRRTRDVVEQALRTLEGFSEFAAGLFHPAVSPDRDVHKEAMDNIPDDIFADPSPSSATDK